MFIAIFRGVLYDLFWFRRNKWLHEQTLIHPSLVVEHALSVAKHFKELQTIPNTQSRKHARWSPPPHNFFKLNVDGSIFFNHNGVGIGLILHDFAGITLKSICCVEAGLCELEDIELLATLRGLQFCLRMGFKNLIVESDCLFMVQVCNSNVIS